MKSDKAMLHAVLETLRGPMVFPQRVGRAAILSRALLVPVLATAGYTLVPLAYAFPPDDMGRPGIYDGADFDDVLTLIAMATAATPLNVREAATLVRIVGAVPHAGAAGLPRARPLRSVSVRAPPALPAIA